MTHLWAPWRSKYVQEGGKGEGCVFCNAAESQNDEESLVVLRAQRCFVLLNRYPYTNGHVMIAPYAHSSRLCQTDVSVTAEMMELARKLEQALESVYRPDGLNLGLNLGEAAGAGIERHLHLHVLPRWFADANFMTTVAETRVLPEGLGESYRKIRAALA